MICNVPLAFDLHVTATVSIMYSYLLKNGTACRLLLPAVSLGRRTDDSNMFDRPSSVNRKAFACVIPSEKSQKG